MADRATLLRDILFFLKDDISSNITDPIAATRSSDSRFVMTTFPERKVEYPLITVEVANVEQTRAGMQTTAMDISLVIIIRIWSKSVAQSDQLNQQILDRLADIQYSAGGSIDNDFHDFTVLSNVRVDEPGEGAVKSRITQVGYRFYNI